MFARCGLASVICDPPPKHGPTRTAALFGYVSVNLDDDNALISALPLRKDQAVFRAAAACRAELRAAGPEDSRMISLCSSTCSTWPAPAPERRLRRSASSRSSAASDMAETGWRTVVSSGQ